MNLTRMVRHLFTPPWRVRAAFPARALRAIEAATREVEAAHEGQIRFAVEAALDLRSLWRDRPARERAIEVFSLLRVWDTERNNGVLIYLLLADRKVEIVADRGIHARVATHEWAGICREMEQAFGAGRFENGVVNGIRAVGTLLAHHFPRSRPGANELPDVPVVL